MTSERDLDQDTIEGSIDTCPAISNVDQTPRESAGSDNDMIDTACDPDPSSNVGAGDHDGDGFLNALDNCPLVSNSSQSELEMSQGSVTDGGPPMDGMGDACDSGTVTFTQNGLTTSVTRSSTVANGQWHLDGDYRAHCFGLTDSDGDGYCAGQSGENDGDAMRHPAWGTGAYSFLAQGDTDGGGADTNSNGTPDTGFDSDWQELYMGTDPVMPCSLSSTPNDEPVDAWRFDTNDSQSVTLSDVTLLGPGFNAAGARRYDQNQDGVFSIADVTVFGPVFNRSCRPIRPQQ
jgi:hypothetical protein